VNNVKHLYFGILQTQGSLDAVEETVKFLRELDRVIEDYVSQQAAMKYESIEVKARLSKAEYDAIALRNVLTTQKEQLNNLLGRDIRTDFRVSQLPSDILFEISIETAHTRALDKRPELKEARLKVKQAEYDRSIKKSEFIPDLSLTANHMRLYNVEMLPEKITTVGFILTWEFFDWGKKRAELAEKKKTIEQAVNGVKEAETQVLIDVNSRFRKLHESRSLLKTREIAMDGAKEKLRVMMNKYTQKAALLKDVLESQASLSDANRQYQEALLSFWTAKVDLEKAIGEE
jgi:outer membrane protein TolC